MITTRFTELIGCTVPLQLAAMGGVGTPQLAAAVAAAGGLGMLPALGPEPLADQWSTVTSILPAGAASPGVNFLGPFLTVADLEQAAALAPLVEVFYLRPDPALVARAHEAPSLVSWQIGSAEEARAAADAGCDLIVAQGVEAGGHVRGTTGLLPLLDAVLAAVEVPVVAAGGIATARSMAAALAAGASAVRVGTRFVGAAESCAHPDYVAALISAGPEDTELTTTFSTGWPDAPHRVLRSAAQAAAALSSDEPAGTTTSLGREWPVPARSAMPPTRDTAGRIDAMALYAGQSVGAVTGVAAAADIVSELAGGAEELLRRRR